MKVKFNDSKNFITLNGFAIGKGEVTLVGKGIGENLSGFILYEDDETTVVRDCSDFVYRWDIYNENANQITFTNSETDRQSKPDKTEKLKEIVDPLSNEELTESVADIIYEISMTQLGL